ncbi:hypothetical protein ABE137_06945 [Brevibacillus laterosporus]|uniref:hypothetical protein n=1 Tax=Brevibacillus laterosporus TaxID=1465 RepID=UPI003D1FAE7E
MVKELINKKIFELLGLVEKDNGFWYFVERITDNEIVAEGYEGHFSFLTGDGMLLLIEEARKEDMFLEFEHAKNNQYLGRAWELRSEKDWLVISKDDAMKSLTTNKIPVAIALSYLQAKCVDIAPYVEDEF